MTPVPFDGAAAPSGQSPAPFGQSGAPSGQSAAPSGQSAAPFGQSAAPSGRSAAPSDEFAAPPDQAAAPFEQASAVEPLGDGRYAALLDPAWNGPVGYSGGVIAAVLLRAAQAELDRADLPPRVLAIHYVAAAVPGPAQVTVTALRVGGRSAVLQAQLHQDERLTATALLTCSVTRPQELTVELNAPVPTVPQVGELTELPAEAIVKGPPMLGRLRMWPCFGGPILGGAGRAVTGGWVALRDDPPDQPIDAPRLAALTDLWWPALFSATSELIGVPTLALTIHLRSTVPATGPILGRYETTTVTEGHLDEAAQLWSADGRLLAESRQLAQLVPGWAA